MKQIFRKNIFNSIISYKRHCAWLLITLSAVFAVSCDDTTDTLGTSLTDVDDIITPSASTFSVESNSVKATDIDSRSRTGYLGKIKDPETQNYVTCNYMTQFRVMGDYQFPNIDSIYVNPDTFDETQEKYKQIEADSCTLVVYISGTYGDSLALMKVSANELSTPYEESKTYTTNFDPEANNMVRTGTGSVHSQMSYTTSNRVYSDEARFSSTYSNRISISLNDPYTDKDGNLYNNYGTYLLRNFYNPAHHSSYYSSYKFAHDICPGFYIKHEGGIGNVISINVSQIVVYFHGIDENGSAVSFNSSFAGTEEIMQKTTLLQDETKLDNLIANSTEYTYVKTPAGIFTELTLPIDEIYSGHENDTINTARIFIPRVNSDIKNGDYTLGVTQTLLMLPTDSVETFFKNKKIADNRTSYLSTYSSLTNGYTFGNISLLISDMYKARQQGTAKENWGKVTLIPVETTYSSVSSSSILTKVTHDMSFSSTKLSRGRTDNDNIKISIIYSKFTE